MKKEVMSFVSFCRLSCFSKATNYEKVMRPQFCGSSRSTSSPIQNFSCVNFKILATIEFT